MAIRTGIGVGAAQIADTSGIMNAYARQIAQQQKLQAAQAQRDFLSAEKEKERAERAAAKFDEDLADIMASAKLGGIRDVDVPEITKAYNEAKDFYSKSGSLKDSQKPLFRAELRNRMNTINDAAINSIEVGKKYYSTAVKVSENPSDYDPKVIQDLDYVNKTPLSKLGGMANMDPLNYQKLPNFGLIDNIIDDTYKIGKENAKFAGEVFDKGKRFNVEKVDPALIQNNLVQRFTTSPEALRAISNLYSRELGKQPTNQELTNYIMDKYKTKHGFDYIGEARDLKEPKEPKSQDNEDVFAGWLTGAFTKNPAESIKNLRSVAGTKITILDKKDGTYDVVYKPMIDVGKGGVPFYIESPMPKTEKATNPGELAGVLRDAGVTGSGSKLISKVGGSYRNPTTVKSTTKTKNTKTVTGKEDPKL
jgi:hypothetical protein